MSDEVKAQIAAEIAAIVQTQDFPTEPFGYGSDISCARDLDPSMAETDGFTTLALAQYVVRRLDTPRGTLPDDKDWGISVTSYLNKGSTSQELLQIAGQVRAELSQDDRIDTLTVQVTSDDVGKTFRLSILITPVAAGLGPFTLTLSASDSGLLLEDIQAAA